MILRYGSEIEFRGMVGAEGAAAAWTSDEFAAVTTFLEAFSKELEAGGELVGAHTLADPVHTRRVSLRDGRPVVTDFPYAPDENVVSAFWIVECADLDRATAIATTLSRCPVPRGPGSVPTTDIRPLEGSLVR